VKVVIGLVIGLAIIIYFFPPSSPCSAQISVYNDAIKNLIKPFNKNMATCRQHPEPGGCVEFFDTLEKIESRFKEVNTQECRNELSKDASTRSWITLSMDLFTLLAWGAKPPPSYLYRNGWLELTQVVEFCRLRKHLEDIYGSNEWAKFVASTTADLPEASGLDENDVWNRSLMSDPCKYPF
jgi:hypothetical protein